MQDKLDNKRIICKSCEYPAVTCICQWVKPIHSPIQIVILQHPKEAKHAKNTVKLLKLGLTNFTVLLGESERDFATFIAEVIKQPKNYSLCYPSKTSTPIESSKHAPLNQDQHTLILIDASWRKALKMWHLNPWLHTLKSWHFSSPPINQYKIRHTTQENSLSTLEAVAYVLEHTQKMDCSHLKTLLTKMQQTSFLGQRDRHPSFL